MHLLAEMIGHWLLRNLTKKFYPIVIPVNYSWTISIFFSPSKLLYKEVSGRRSLTSIVSTPLSTCYLNKVRPSPNYTCAYNKIFHQIQGSFENSCNLATQEIWQTVQEELQVQRKACTLANLSPRQLSAQVSELLLKLSAHYDHRVPTVSHWFQ